MMSLRSSSSVVVESLIRSADSLRNLGQVQSHDVNALRRRNLRRSSSSLAALVTSDVQEHNSVLLVFPVATAAHIC
jgi:hypothetical protein